ncbi:hypothetical protein CGZ65_00530 [Neisseria weixii]|nr:hypothetical protein CGZ65_00530 [Neisseria weixii]
MPYKCRGWPENPKFLFFIGLYFYVQSCVETFEEAKMNKTYRVVYNETTNTYTAVAEIAAARGKSSKSSVAAAADATAVRV